MKKRGFLSAVAAGCASLFGLSKVGLAKPYLPGNTSVGASPVKIIKVSATVDNPGTIVRDHAADVYPIVYETSKKPPNTTAIVRIFCRMQQDSTYCKWFYNQNEHWVNGCNHSDFKPFFQCESVDDTVCDRLEHGGFLNSWTSCDWSFLQDDDTWRNWNTFWNEETGTLNDFQPNVEAMSPYPPYCVTKVCFINRYDFILYVQVNGDKINKIRMNGFCQNTEDWLINNYTRFSDREFIPASEYLQSVWLNNDARLHDVEVLLTEYIPVLNGFAFATLPVSFSCEWYEPQTWCVKEHPLFSENVFATRQ